MLLKSNKIPKKQCQYVDSENNQSFAKNEYMHQRRPMTSYGKMQSTQPHPLQLQQSSGQMKPFSTTNNFIRRQVVPSPKQNMIRPSTVQSSQFNNTRQQGFFGTTQKKPYHIGQSFGEQFGGTLKQDKSNRKIPTQIPQDKEELYELQRQLKNQNNLLLEENLKLRTRNTNLEREAKKFERMVEEKSGNPAGQQQQMENPLSIRLRKQLKECLEELKNKSDELESFKKCITTTRIQELEIQAKTDALENQRLKGMLEQSMKNFGIKKRGDESQQQDDSIFIKRLEALKNDNLEMAVLIQNLEKEKNEISVRERESEKQLQIMKKNQIFMKREIQQQEDEIRRLKSEELGVSFGKKSGLNQAQNGLAEYNQKLKADQEKMSKENSKLNNQLIIKSEKIKELEDKIRRENQEWQERLEQLRVQKDISERNYNQELLLSKNREDRIKELEELLVNNNNGDYSQNGNNNQDGAGDGSGRSQLHEEQKSNGERSGINDGKYDDKQLKKKGTDNNKKILPRVVKDDVSKIGRDIRFGLLDQSKKYEDIEKFLLTPELKKKGKVSINDVAAIIAKEPFFVKNSEDAILVARFMIEDNSEDKILFDENRTNDITVVKTVFKNLIGKYNVFTIQEELILYAEISKLFSIQYQGIKQNIEYLKKQAKDTEEGVCKLEDFKKSLDEFDNGISARHLDYITMYIFRDSHDTDRVYYPKILQIFSLQQFEQFKQQHSGDQNNSNNSDNQNNRSLENKNDEEGIEKIQLEQEQENNNEHSDNQNEFNNNYVEDQQQEEYLQEQESLKQQERQQEQEDLQDDNQNPENPTD